VRLTSEDRLAFPVSLRLLHGANSRASLERQSLFYGCNRIGNLGVACGETATEIEKEIFSSHVRRRNYDC